jgi:UDP-N-acetylglucosamine--N-acetylmuramyl-(pentapeptide) pyrophosphoryl-undecaprenol N-acetylglucosamine transferase
VARDGSPTPALDAARSASGRASVVITGGGTGGHTSPGLAVASVLRERGVSCAWIGSRGGVEARLVPERGIPYAAVPAGKLRRYWSWRNAADLAVNVPLGIGLAGRLLLRLRPRVVFSTGGFVALPVTLAAVSLGIPVVIHEQTAVPGLANRLAARFARRIAVTFPDARGRFPQARVVRTGNPLRPELVAGSRADTMARYGLDPGLPLVYATGGSLGANALNRAIGTTLVRLLETAQVIHQTGDNPTTGDRQWLQARRAELPPPLARRYTLVPWVGPELAGIYATASLVIGRSGAGTVNECCQLGVPALYVPMPGGGGDEQMANARLVERAGGCAVLPQGALSPESLLERVRGLLANPGALKEMGERARSLAVPDAAERLVALLLETGNL